MRASEQFDFDDLVLYAMRMLAEPKLSVVTRALAEDAATRQKIVELEAALGAFAESAVQLQPVPEGSLDQLLARIELEERRKPVRTPVSTSRPVYEQKWFYPWFSWAVAALLALSAGLLYEQKTVLLRRMAESETSANQQRGLLQASVKSQAKEVERLQAELNRAQSAAAGLQHAVAGQATTLIETARAATSAERERDSLRGTLAAQTDQVSQLTADRQSAALVLDALRDPSALRVTLKMPTSKASPAGRAAYVAARGTLVFLASNMAPLHANKVYELWLLPADGSSPVAAGTFVPDANGSASLIYPRFPNAVSAKGFAVTIEGPSGSQTPTLPLILAGL